MWASQPPIFLFPKLTLPPTVLFGIHLHSHSLNPCAHKPHTTPPLASHSVVPGPAASHPLVATQTGRILSHPILLNPNLHSNKNSEGLCECIRI